MDPRKVTAVILTRDEERNLPRAMTSLPREMHVLVLDANSDDRTVEYARGAGAEVIEREWTDFVDARTFAFAQVRTPWTLMIDADEALDDVLCDAIVNADESVCGYTVRRTTFFAGKRMRMWSNEPLLRLVRTEEIVLETHSATGAAAPLHETLRCGGETAELRGTLLHFSYDDAAAYREKFRRYTAIEAAALSPSSGRFAKELLLAPVRLVSNLVRRGALLDGRRGWFVAWYSAWYPAVAAWKAMR